MSNDFCIVVHGGCTEKVESDDEFDYDKYKESIGNIAQVASDFLSSGGSALDAVQKAIEMLEDDPLYNAGTGCCLTCEGTVELDAMLMNGKDRALGAVAGVNFAKNPIQLARLVMDKSKHCFISGEGLKSFAVKQDFPVLSDAKSLVTSSSLNQWEKLRDREVGKCKYTQKHLCGDTVGAVAIDCNGDLACGTSTGGICGKMPGRIGDVPLVGCGGFANINGAASCTGHGESIMKYTCCRDVVGSFEYGETPESSAKRVVGNIHNSTGGCVGVICLNRTGEFGVHHNGAFMPWASVGNKTGCNIFKNTLFSASQ